MNAILLSCVVVMALAATAASCPVCCAKRPSACQGKDTGNTGNWDNKGQDSGNKGQDSGNTGNWDNKGQDSGNTGSDKGQDSGNKGQDSGNTDNKGQNWNDSVSKAPGSSSGSAGAAAAGSKPRVEQLSISSGNTTLTKSVATAQAGAVAAGGSSQSNK